MQILTGLSFNMGACIHKKMESIKNIGHDYDVDDVITVNYTSVMPVQNTLLTYTRTALQNHTPLRYAPTYLPCACQILDFHNGHVPPCSFACHHT